jgi:ABC-type xylose transport system, periplasmic component
MTVYKPIARLATRAASLAVSIARGEKLMTSLAVDNRSGAMIPYYMEEPVPVFRSNMDSTVIRDGFHSFEDVYRNLPRTAEPADGNTQVKK